MKKFISLFILLGMITALIGCAGYNKGSSGTRDNPTDLKKSPCAGCFGEDEKDRLNLKDAHNA